MSDFDFSTRFDRQPREGGDDAQLGEERVVTAQPTGSDEEIERSLRPKRLDEFTGQRRAKEQLRVFIDAARQRDEALDHALFAGPPGLGKCVTPDTLLLTAHGMVPIGELGDLEGESWQPIRRAVGGLYGLRTADYFYNNGESDTLRITSERGYRVEGTPNHPLLVKGRDGSVQFRRLSELETGDCVAIRMNAQLFGSTTALRVEGIKSPSLEDAAVVPRQLSVELARLLGLLLQSGKLLPEAAGFIVSVKLDERARELRRLCSELFCIELQDAGVGEAGTVQRLVCRSGRVGHFLQALGLEAEGFTDCPAAIYRAPKEQVAGFLTGVFSGVEDRPYCTNRSRRVIAHLQVMLANFGIEAAIAPSEYGFQLSICERSGHRGINGDGVPNHDGELYGEHDQMLDRVEDPVEFSFGTLRASGGHHGHDEPRVATSVSSAVAVSVAEVEPSERGRALLRRHVLHGDHRALAVRSASASLRAEDALELVWDAVASIEPGHAHTCDVSVPDGHTFIGNAIVCHNTTLASVVANELGTTMRQTSGPALDKKADIAAILTSLEPRDVLFIDEIHRLNTAVEEVLYSAMEDFQIDIVLGQGPAARTVRLELAPFTLVGATTRTGLLTTPLRDRFGVIQRLDYYEPAELQKIVQRSAGLLGIEIDEQAAYEIARRSRGTPRIANRLLRRVRDVAQVRHAGDITLDIAQEALDLVEVDGEGLDRVDRAILETILTKFGGGPVGLSTLSVAIGEEPHTIEDVYEPFLLQRGLIQRTPRGRIITGAGRVHLGAPAIAPSGGVEPMF